MYPSREQINKERKDWLKKRIMEEIGDDQKTSVQLANIIGVERYHLKYALMDLEAEGLLRHEPRGSKLYLYYKPKRHPLDEIFNHNLNITPTELEYKFTHITCLFLFAACIVRTTKNYDLAYSLGKLALDLDEKHNNPNVNTKIMIFFAIFNVLIYHTLLKKPN